jgi:heptose-I-phosphate ethanolaminephosphotransferase
MRAILTTLNQIFPLYLTLLVNFPIILGLFINSDLVSLRLIIINFLWQTLFVILYRTAKSYSIYRTGVFIISIIVIIESLHWIILKGPLSTSSLFVISATNYQESIDFLSIKIGLNLLLIAPLLVISILAWKHRPIHKKYSNNPYFYGIFLLIFLGFVLENAVNNRLVRKGVPNFIKVAITFEQQLDQFKTAKESKAIQIVDAKSVVKKQTVILILGESCNRNHMQLYGNENATTPLLSNRDDLYVFDNVISSYSNTISSVLTSLSETALDNTIPLNEGADIMDVFSSAGYTNYWVSNQSPIGIWENLVTVFARKANHPIFVNLSSSNSMESTLMSSYDELLFEPIEKVLKKEDSLKFIIIHTMGNHSSYKSRYPTEFNKFKGNDGKSQTIAEYHNSILYHDYVLDSLLKIINQNTENAVVIYTADHGENVYDEGGNLGHDYAGKLPKSNVEIPFFIWFSDEFKNTNSKFSEVAESRKNAPYVTDHLFHTLIDLARLQTPLLKPGNSIVNANFESKRKRILEDGKDYDE